MEESAASTISEGEIVGIKFALATHNEICKSSISECPISHQSQLSNPFLGLPLEVGKCESCGTSEPGECEGHFGFIELPIKVYHPDHVLELKRLLNLVCLQCLKMKNNKFPSKSNGMFEKLLSSCCEEASNISVKENSTSDGAIFLELKLPSKSKARDGVWDFLRKYGYRYGDGLSRTLLASEAFVMLKNLPEETKKKLSRKGYFPQEGYILHYLPVPPNCLSVPEISDGVSVISSDLSTSMLKKVLRKIEVIKSSRSGQPNFEAHEVEANVIQIAVAQYLQARGSGKVSREVGKHFGPNQELSNTSAKAWLEKMRTLFISKGSGFSSRSVITGDAYRSVDEVGLPAEIAQRITFQERVNDHNFSYLQGLVDKKLCLTYKDGSSTYSLKEGSKGHTFLRPGQLVHRRIMDGDIVFINRPPTTHKHSLQALRVYIHEGHTVKINPLMCGPLAADFDGDCVHLFYPQSLSAKAEVIELFSVENQLLSSHSGYLNLQMAIDSLLALKVILKGYFLNRSSAQQLAMFASSWLPPPALLRARDFGPLWTALQVLQTALPAEFDCFGDRHRIYKSEILSLDYNGEVMPSFINEVVTSIIFEKGPKDALSTFDALQPLLMEYLFAEGFSVGLQDFLISAGIVESIQRQMQDTSPLLFQLRSAYNELVEQQLETYMKLLKVPLVTFILKQSALGNLIDSKRDSAIAKVMQQIGFLGLQLSDKGKFYSRNLLEDVASLFHHRHPFSSECPAEEYGMVKSSFFHGLDPYEEIVHSISNREVMIRSTKGLAEPGTLFKNLMAILRDVVICYDGSVRNISSQCVLQFEYGVNVGRSPCLFPPGEPVGVLAATAMSNPAYKAVLDSSTSSNSSWEMMKEILFHHVNFRNDIIDRRVIFYLNDCRCGRQYCQENAAYKAKNMLKKVSLKEAAIEFLIEYKSPLMVSEGVDIATGLVGHIHLNEALVNDSNIGMRDIFEKCQDEINLWKKNKKIGIHFKKINLVASDCCCFQPGSKWSKLPCLQFVWPDITNSHLERISHVMADVICPVLLDTTIKGDPRISTVNIVWVSPDSTTWIGGISKHQKGELAVEVVLEKKAVKRSGDAWRIALDCCLPVFHLIDTKRSIPYALKQIQELFGISAAFEQAVQRLYSSVTTVSKGLLKEHLILLASSMTCVGNLIGFNKSGVKALCRALGPQVPFTEATLYTPRKCFERAAAKCHADSLSSIVASCSWGKHVAVGTGDKFDILWKHKEMEKSEDGIDVYNFLQLVRGANELDQDSGCLGEDIENFEEYMEPGSSPDHGKAVFEDNGEMAIDLETQVPDGGSGWEKLSHSGAAAGGEWNVSKTQESCGWSSWGPKKCDQHLETMSAAGEQNGFNSGGLEEGWTVNRTQDVGSPGWGLKSSKQQQENVSGSDGWNAPKSSNERSPSRINQEKEVDGYHAKSNLSRQSTEPPATPWNSSTGKRPTHDSVSSDKWNKAVESTKKWSCDQSFEPTFHGEPKSGKASTDFNVNVTNSSWEKSSLPLNKDDWGFDTPCQPSSSDGWDSKTPPVNSKRTESTWGQKSAFAGKDDTTKNWDSSNMLQEASSPRRDSGKAVSRTEGTWSPWGNDSSSPSKDNLEKRSCIDNEHQAAGSCRWNSGTAGTVENPTQSRWGQKSASWKKNPEKNWGTDKSCQLGTSGGWNSGKTTANDCSMENPNGWSGASTWKKNPAESGMGAADDENQTQSTWGQRNASWKNNSEENWGTDKSCQLGDTGGWDSGKASASNGSTEPSKGWSGSSTWTKKPTGSGMAGAGDENQARSTWGQLVSYDEDVGKASANDGSIQSPKGCSSSSTWKKSSSNWGSGKSNSPGSDKEKSGFNNEDGTQLETQSPWGQPSSTKWKKHLPDNGHGWGSSGGAWRSKRSQPTKSPGVPNNGAKSGSFPVNRQRVDLYTPEEQNILSEIQPIIQSVRRIMNQPGYNDGDPISAEDQSYVVDQVLGYHPDKVAKMGVGIEYIMVNKHSSFQDTRCFYLVRTDGHKEDFSYKKCLENFVRQKHTDHAETFIAKYFRKPRRDENGVQE